MDRIGSRESPGHHRSPAHLGQPVRSRQCTTLRQQGQCDVRPQRPRVRHRHCDRCRQKHHYGRAQNSQFVTYNPARFRGISGAYRQDERTFSTGDVVQFTAKSKELGIDNRDRATIKGFTRDGRICVQLYRGADKPPGRTLTIDTATFGHIDHAYAVTSHSSQGLTEVNAILDIDTSNMNPQLINDRLAYVAGSRMKASLTIYCNDRSKLADALARDVSKTSAIAPPETTIARAAGRNPPLQAALDLLHQGRTHDALDRLGSLGVVVEIPDAHARHAALAHAYAADSGRPVVVAPDPNLRALLNRTIHETLDSVGQLDTAQLQSTVLVPRRDFTGPDRKCAGVYDVGDIIRYDDAPSKLLRRIRKVDVSPGEYVTVTDVDYEANRITVRKKDGQTLTYDPEYRAAVSIYRPEPRSFAKGERIEFTAREKHLGISSRQRATIVGITADDKLDVQLDSSARTHGKPRVVQIDPATFQHFDHTYVAASDFARRTPAEKHHTLVAVTSDTLDGRTLAARLDNAAAHGEKLTIYCDNADTLINAVRPALTRRALLREQRHVAAKQQLTVAPPVPAILHKAPNIEIPELVRRPAAQHWQSPEHATPQHSLAPPSQQHMVQTPQPAHQQLQPSGPARPQTAATPEQKVAVKPPAKQQQIQNSPLSNTDSRYEHLRGCGEKQSAPWPSQEAPDGWSRIDPSGASPRRACKRSWQNFRKPLAHHASRNFLPDAAPNPRAPAVAYPTAPAAPEVVVGNNLRTIVRTVGSRNGEGTLCGSVSNRPVGSPGSNPVGAHILGRHSSCIHGAQSTLFRYFCRTLFGTAAKFL